MSADGFACDRCHRRKTRCDKERPQCAPCTRANVECRYSDRTKEPVFRRDVVEKLERRVRQLENANLALTERLSSARDASVQVLAANDVANEVSYLAAHAGGDRQFLGATSGIVFANLVKAGLYRTTKVRSAIEVESPINAPNPGQQRSNEEWEVDQFSLPPRQLASSLTEAYLAHDHICYPFLLPQAIRAAVDAVYDVVSFYHKNPFEAFMFNMLLAIGTSQVHKFNWQALPDAETHHLRAMTHLDCILNGGGLRALQSILLLCQFRLSSSTKDTSGSLWHLVGIAVRMCMELGLHQEQSYQINQHTPSDNELELRRRCFWCTFALDRVVSLTLGRPFAIHTEDIDVELPSTERDTLFNTGLTPGSTSEEQSQDQNVSKSRTAIFVHIVRYRALCGQILTSLHRERRRTPDREQEVRRIRTRLADELKAWRADTPLLDLPEIDLSTPLAEARSSFRSLAWHEMLYHNGVLLLFRPSSIADSENSEGNLDQVFYAAQQSIILYAYLFRSRKINFSWITLHAVFMAGLSYVYALSRHLRENRRQIAISPLQPLTTLTTMPSIPQMVADCRACSNVLVAVSERCNAQKNSHEVFDRLSDAVLADAVDAISKPSTKPQTLELAGQSSSSTPISFQHSETDLPRNQCRLGDQRNEQSAAQFSAPAAASEPSSYNQYDLNFLPLATDDALRDCYPNLQQMYDGQWGNDTILQLSTEWLGEVYSPQQFAEWRFG